MKKDEQVEVDEVSSFWFGVFTLILAFIGSWISFHAFAAIINGIITGESFSLSGVEIQSVLVFLTITFVTPVLSILLFVLSYRLITGRGHPSENGLVSPSVLITLSILTVGVGILGFYFAWTEKEIKSAIFGVVLSIVGVKGIYLGMDRFGK
ncbi:MAG: hypothetical protein P8X88_09020 [Gammaproteobacteria bacterium]